MPLLKTFLRSSERGKKGGGKRILNFRHKISWNNLKSLFRCVILVIKSFFVLAPANHGTGGLNKWQESKHKQYQSDNQKYQSIMNFKSCMSWFNTLFTCFCLIDDTKLILWPKRKKTGQNLTKRNGNTGRFYFRDEQQKTKQKTNKQTNKNNNNNNITHPTISRHNEMLRALLSNRRQWKRSPRYSLKTNDWKVNLNDCGYGKILIRLKYKT